MGVSEQAPKAAAVLHLWKSGQPQDTPPWPGRPPPSRGATAVVCTPVVLPLCIVVTSMRSINTEGPPRNEVCREMNRDVAHRF